RENDALPARNKACKKTTHLPFFLPLWRPAALETQGALPAQVLCRLIGQPSNAQSHWVDGEEIRIEEGLAILESIGAPLRAQQAYCLHPLLQDDESQGSSCLTGSILLRHEPEPIAVVLAMEYRRVANAYLSRHYNGADDAIALSPLSEVNQMPIADKVQNRKNFEIHHFGSHPRSDVLGGYFDNWLKVLGVSESGYLQLCRMLEEHAQS
ncbi:MAG: hypothetical protein ACREP7_13555, partial [Lysobacter sp.]